MLRSLLSLACLAPAALTQTCPTPLDLVPSGSSSPTFAAHAVGDVLYFTAGTPGSGAELWRWDPVGGVQQLSDLNGVQAGAFGAPVPLFLGGSTEVFFTGADTAPGVEVFLSDGTLGGAALLADLNPGDESSQPGGFTPNGAQVLFHAKSGPNLNFDQLMATDGTATTVVRAVAEGGPMAPRGLTRFGTRVLMNAFGTGTSNEPWISDGTKAGTFMLADLNPGVSSSSPQDFTPLGDLAVFSAIDPSFGRELFVTDGTSAGTQLLIDLNPGVGGSFPGQFVEWRGLIYFVATTGANGAELWRTDGTAAGTQLALEFFAGPPSSGFGVLTPAGDKLYFSASGPGFFNVIVELDGATGATTLISTTGEDLLPTELVVADGGVYIAGTTPVFGRELYFADGVSTTLVCDLTAGAFGSDPAQLVATRDHLVFAATGDGVGREPFVLPFSGPTAVDLDAGMETLRFEVGTPRLGQPLALRVDHNPTGAVGFVAFSPVAAPSAGLFVPGAVTWLDVATAQLARVFTGPSLESSFALPNDPSLAGVRAHAQAFGLRPTGLPLEVSNGVALTLGF